MTSRFSGSDASLLTLGRACRVARRLEISLDRVAYLILPFHFVLMRHDRCLDDVRLHNAQHFISDVGIHTRATKADTARQTLVEPGTMARVVRNVAALASIIARSASLRSAGSEVALRARRYPCGRRRDRKDRAVGVDCGLHTLEAPSVDSVRSGSARTTGRVAFSART